MAQALAGRHQWGLAKKAGTMNRNREAILGRLKTKLNRETRLPTEALARMQSLPKSIIPARGADDLKNKVQRFMEEAQRVDATVTQIDVLEDLPGAVRDYLASQNLPTEIRVAPTLANVPWADQPLLAAATGVAEATDAIGISCAFGGVAETGTLVYLSGAENPSTLHFLPPTHIAVLAAKDIVGNYESAWARIRHQSRKERGRGNRLPRAVCWVTGPSRSGDIEQTLLLGAHGPQRLHIVVIANG